ncbi:MAG: hypothetical protein NTV99_11135 [Deltaproteobacteria bacterium]|nr:hypothetical protein [Deltaproteobacteria bacterium]
MNRSSVIFSIVLSVLTLCLAIPVNASDNSIQKMLPIPECPKGWLLEDKVVLYDRETLFDYINGEAELYFPYGFEVLATARYVQKGNPDTAIAADVYRMASLLDAFGIYSNYRKPDAAASQIGAEGFLSSSQLMFYQDRYFIRLQASGVTSIEKDVFLACGRAISKNLPPGAGRPGEVEILHVPGVLPGTVRYIARSLLGYAFLRRGLVADANLEGEKMQVFLVPEDSKEAARRAFDQYHAYLKGSGKDVQATETGGRISMQAVDPLYGRVFVEQSGRYLMGAVRAQKISAAKKIVGEMSGRRVSQ